MRSDSIVQCENWLQPKNSEASMMLYAAKNGTTKTGGRKFPTTGNQIRKTPQTRMSDNVIPSSACRGTL